MKKKLLIWIASIIAAAALVCGSVIAVSFIQDRKIETTVYTVTSDKVPASFDNYTIAFLTDYHNAYYYEQAIQAVAEIKPDVIFFGGDMINMHEEVYANTVELIKGLQEIAQIYMVSGNHEKYRSDWGKGAYVLLEGLGVKIIDDRSVYLEKGRDKIHVFGLPDPGVDDNQFEAAIWMKDVKNRAKATFDKKTFNLIISHRANYFDEIYELGYDLILSGHMHGGVVRLPFVGGLFSPDNKHLFPGYTEGRYKKGDSIMIVNRGMDYNTKRMRILNQPEVLKVVLRNK